LHCTVRQRVELLAADLIAPAKPNEVGAARRSWRPLAERRSLVERAVGPVRVVER
jgi:hypothetical protein